MKNTLKGRKWDPQSRCSPGKSGGGVGRRTVAMGQGSCGGRAREHENTAGSTSEAERRVSVWQRRGQARVTAYLTHRKGGAVRTCPPLQIIYSGTPNDFPLPRVFSSTIRDTMALDLSSAGCPSQNHVITAIATLRFLLPRLMEAWG